MAKTVDEGFIALLNKLVPLESENDKAKSHKSSVRSCLETNFKCYSFIETGSFGNSTGVRHYSDADYFAVCPNEEMWADSGYTLRKFKENLSNTFWDTQGISVNTPAVQIPFGNYASENLEVTPATFKGLISTPLGQKGSYSIPDYDDGWMLSSPDAHNAYVKKHDERLSYRLKPLIRLIKAWKFYNNVPIMSFYLELRVTKYAEDQTHIDYEIDVKDFMKFLYNNDLPGINDPMGISGNVKACSSDSKREEALSKLSTGYTRAQKAVDARGTNVDNAFYYWNLFYNDKFPAR